MYPFLSSQSRLSLTSHVLYETSLKGYASRGMVAGPLNTSGSRQHQQLDVERLRVARKLYMEYCIASP